MDLRCNIEKLNVDGNYWAQRIYCQLEYLLNLLSFHPECDTIPLEAAISILLQQKQDTGTVTKDAVLEAEQRLACYSNLAKTLRLHLVSHAHMDMDWMWGWHETVNIVTDTARTMLSLLRQYPDFTYSQSQAATYAILEQYAPELLPQICQYVKEGRWEVLASTWTEHDKNMVSTESMIRQILYAKQYLQQLFDLSPDQLQIDFEPDTFGHSRELPEFLHQGGIRYYYHCRGNDQEELYRWQASSGAEVLVFRDPQWYYLRNMDYRIAYHVPEFCHKNHTTSALRIYGVGDHGGGPSRRDIERLLDMQCWPLFPDMAFSTLRRFFADIEPLKDQFPIVNRELNAVFTGCYTAQSRLKQANRQSEDRLYDCEALSVMAKLAGCDISGIPDVKPAWKETLFNQFHDILPGSCNREAKERALGRFQDTSAWSTTISKRAMELLCEKISTDSYSCTFKPTDTAESAGHGFGNASDSVGRSIYTSNFCSRSAGSVRVYTVFNPTMYERNEILALTLWDWEVPMDCTSVCTPTGAQIPFDTAKHHIPYWQHHYTVIHFPVQIPPFGYCNYYVRSCSQPLTPKTYFSGPRIHTPVDTPFILENEYLKAVFSSKTMMLESFISKHDGTDLITCPSAFFSLIDEQTVLPYSSWTVGREGHHCILNETHFVQIEDETSGKYTQSVTYCIRFHNSTIRVHISLPKYSRILRFSVSADWKERGSDTITPQLRFCVPFSYGSTETCYDIPGGHILRTPIPQDVPALHYASPLPNSPHSAIFLTSNCKYGYRTDKNVLSVSLIRSTIHPDPDPETGSVSMELGLGVIDSVDWMLLTEQAVIFSHPLYAFSNTIHTGRLPQSASLLQIHGRASIAGCKVSETKHETALHLLQQDPTPSPVSICTRSPIYAERSDTLERPLHVLSKFETRTEITIPPASLYTILIASAAPPDDNTISAL